MQIDVPTAGRMVTVSDWKVGESSTKSANKQSASRAGSAQRGCIVERIAPCIRVRLLGQCFKTGWLKPLCQHLQGAGPALHRVNPNAATKHLSVQLLRKAPRDGPAARRALGASAPHGSCAESQSVWPLLLVRADYIGRARGRGQEGTGIAQAVTANFVMQDFKLKDMSKRDICTTHCTQLNGVGFNMKIHAIFMAKCHRQS